MDCSAKHLHEICRICLQQKGEIHMRDNFIEVEDSTGIRRTDSGVLTILELFHIFTNNEENFLELVNEVPLICEECLKDLTYCYMFYNKLKDAHIHMKQLYQDSLNNTVYCKEEEEEYVVDKEESNEKIRVENHEIVEIKEEYQLQNNTDGATENASSLTSNENDEVSNINIDARNPENSSTKVILNGKVYMESQKCRNILDKDFSVVIPHFLPASYNAKSAERVASRTTKRKLMTIECQTIEVTGSKELQNIGSISDINYDNYTGKDIMYICKYCPQAFAKFSYLKNHLQKSHICKFCTNAFKLTTDLFKHVRKVHAEHKCVICNRKLSSHSNLRNHIKRVHGIKLPGEVVLLDYIEKPSTYKDDIVYLDYS